MNYDILLFDADRTLFDFDASEKAAFTKVAPEFGINPTDEVYLTYKRFNDENWEMLERGELEKPRILVRRFEQILNYCGLDISCATKLNAKYLKTLACESIIFPESVWVLTELKKCGKRLFLITNGVTEVQKGRLSRSPLKDFFEELFISDEIGFEKPSPEFFKAVENGIENFNKQKSIVIGDSLTSDIKGANLSGISCVWLNAKNSQLPNGYKANYIITKLEQVLDIIK